MLYLQKLKSVLGTILFQGSILEKMLWIFVIDIFVSSLIDSIQSPKVLIDFTFCLNKFLHFGLNVLWYAGLVGFALSFV